MILNALYGSLLRITLLLCCFGLGGGGLTAQKAISRKLNNEIDKRVAASEVFERGFTGFVLFDPAERQLLYNYRGGKYFTPASNTKILTYFAAEHVLGDVWPVVRYQTKSDTLLLWGTGYPLLLHPDFIGYDTLATWLQDRPEKTWIINNGHYQDERYGEGWSWDDFPYGYQMEKAALPLYGNAAHFTKVGHLGKIKVMPPYFSDRLIYENTRTLGRYEDRNIFTFGERAVLANELDRSIGFNYTFSLAEKLLKDTFHREIHFTQQPLPPDSLLQTLTTAIPDTVYRRFLQDSNNFLAEQLLQMASAQRYGDIDTERILNYVRDTVLSAAPQPLDWVDGSGLSRYNQFTPLGVISVLDQLYTQEGQARLFQLFPAGGVSGTIERNYAGPDGTPFVYAKTGTLRHIHCLSGYLTAENGKTYLFSFMHNNYPGKIRELRKEMEIVLLWLRGNLP